MSKKLILDPITEIDGEEFSDHLKKGKEKTGNLEELFRIQRQNLKRVLMIDHINLMQIPSSRLSKDYRKWTTSYKLSNVERMFWQIAGKNMISKQEEDHKNVYLTKYDYVIN
jgi:hypothetical protein